MSIVEPPERIDLVRVKIGNNYLDEIVSRLRQTDTKFDGDTQPRVISFGYIGCFLTECPETHPGDGTDLYPIIIPGFELYFPEPLTEEQLRKQGIDTEGLKTGNERLCAMVAYHQINDDDHEPPRMKMLRVQGEVTDSRQYDLEMVERYIVENLDFLKRMFETNTSLGVTSHGVQAYADSEDDLVRIFREKFEKPYPLITSVANFRSPVFDEV
jgi:hypothetical protein